MNPMTTTVVISRAFRFVVPPSGGIERERCADFRLKAGLRTIHMTALLLFLLAFTVNAKTFGQSVDQQLRVVEQIWGFDGRVQPGQFNPLSILLDNQTDTPIDATATLQRIQGLLTPTGGQYTQPVFIAPTARRWIQFYPYVPDSQQSEWRLALNDRKVQDFTQPRPAIKLGTEKEDPPPQIIILDKANRITTQPSSLKHLPENVFPPYATVTFGLHSVFLDHIPDWETPRQQAFLSWLKQGGRLHILKNGRDEYPRFTGDLAEISQPFDRFSVGNGVVVRHAFQRNGVTAELVKRVTVIDVLKGKDDEIEKQIQAAQKNNNFGVNSLFETEPSAIDDSFFRGMRELTLPEHAWWLIFLLALCYIGLIFPGCYILSKQKTLHFLTTYGAIVGLSVVFSVLFLFIGRRGYGEATTLQTLGIARAEDATHWSLFQWNALFVTSGDDYTAQAPDQQAVLSTADTMEKANAQIVAGNKGHIAMRIPPFSSQTFVSRRRVTTVDWKLKLLEFEGNRTSLVKLTMQTADGFPAHEAAEYFVLLGRNVSTLRYDDESKQLKLFGARKALAAFCQPQFTNGFANPWNQPASRDDRTELQKFYDQALSSLTYRSLFDDLVTTPSRFELPADRLRLLVYTPVPEELELDISAKAKRTGRILFVKDVLLSGKQ